MALRAMSPRKMSFDQRRGSRDICTLLNCVRDTVRYRREGGRQVRKRVMFDLAWSTYRLLPVQHRRPWIH